MSKSSDRDCLCFAGIWFIEPDAVAPAHLGKPKCQGAVRVWPKAQTLVSMDNESDEVKEGHSVDALALRGDEGRGTLR